jgi:hypothetical protein
VKGNDQDGRPQSFGRSQDRRDQIHYVELVAVTAARSA